ncbi:MAG: glycosyltransferase family 2 protein [Planctomycetota bacterium]
MNDAPPSPPPLSVAITCFNSAATIERLLDSIEGLASQVVAVDSGSTDATLGILRARGIEPIHQDFLGHVKQKQFALERCEQPWALHLDADESLEPDLRDAIRDVIARNDPAVGACAMIRKVWYAGRLLDHAWQPEWRVRLVRTGSAAWGGYDPHDHLSLTDDARARGLRVEKIIGVMRHDTMPSAADFLARQVAHGRIAAASYERLGKRTNPLRVALSPLGAWLKEMVIRRAFLDGWRGWVAASCAASAALAKHTILLERQRTEGDS